MKMLIRIRISNYTDRITNGKICIQILSVPEIPIISDNIAEI